MLGKIGLEEHFAIPETVDVSKGPLPADSWEELRMRLLDIQDKRLRLMDEHGIEMMLLSLNSPAIQAIPDVKQAIDIARISNDYLAAEIAKRFGRLDVLVSNAGIGIAVRKGNDLLRQALNWALFRVWEKGRYTDLWLRYFSVSPF